MSRVEYPAEHLLFRRQFILGPRYLDGFPAWSRVEVRPTLRLTVHPDLPVTCRRTGDLSIVLLGYIIDPNAPDASDSEIVERLLLHVGPGAPPGDLISQTDAFGGRWILIVDDGRSPWLFNDPCGYRSVFYYRTSTGESGWCASHPGLLGEVLGLRADPEFLRFVRWTRKRDPLSWWPGSTSPYKEVSHMQPNHYLNLDDGTCRRFWPSGDIPKGDVEEVVIENARLLRSLIEAASQRFGLALAITAGRDSRLLLAASREVGDQLYVFTQKFWDLDAQTPDIQIPSRLLSRLGLPHYILPCPDRMNRRFRSVYRRSVIHTPEIYGALTQGLYHEYPQERVCMYGTAIPITDGGFTYPPGHERTTPHDAVDPVLLAQLTQRNHEFARVAINRWLSGMPRTNIDPLDLFYWEEREGNWVAMTLSGQDLAQEVFVPFNCRRFLVNMLSLPAEERLLTMHERLMRHLWPDVLSEPVNPKWTRTPIGLVRAFLKRPGKRSWRWLWQETIGRRLRRLH